MPLVYREVAPSRTLAPFVKCFWQLRGHPDEEPASERILPDGAFELVFHCGEPFASEGQLQPAGMLVGQIKRPTLVTPSARVDVFGVRFYVGGAAPFFRMPLSELSDQILPAGEVLREWPRVLEATTPSGRIAALERLLMDRIEIPDRWKTARAITALIARRGGRIRLGSLPGATGLTERTIQRAFTTCVGMPAKTYSRLVRMHAWIADPHMEHGYVDDAHLIHDFQSFAGITPRQFQLEQHAMNDAFHAAV